MYKLSIISFSLVLACSGATKGPGDGGAQEATTGENGGSTAPTVGGCDNFGGTYSLKYKHLSGTCNPNLPDGITVVPRASETSDAGAVPKGCVVHAGSASKSDPCRVNMDVECFDDASNKYHRTTGVIQATDGGAKATATLQIKIYDDSGVDCQSTYEVTYTQLSD